MRAKTRASLQLWVVFVVAGCCCSLCCCYYYFSSCFCCCCCCRLHLATQIERTCCSQRGKNWMLCTCLCGHKTALRKQKTPRYWWFSGSVVRWSGGALSVVTTIDYMPRNGSHYRSWGAQMRVLLACQQHGDMLLQCPSSNIELARSL